jgi:hypothetical protein
VSFGFEREREGGGERSWKGEEVGRSRTDRADEREIGLVEEVATVMSIEGGLLGTSYVGINK